jgi:hypothetical protein
MPIHYGTIYVGLWERVCEIYGIGRDRPRRIEVWVTNLTNEIARGTTFNTALRSGSRSDFIAQEPRMYGVTLRGEF